MNADTTPSAIWATIIIIGMITFALRYVPIALLARLQLPGWLQRMLTYSPPAVITAILIPPLFFPGGAPTMSHDLPRLAAALVAAVVAWHTRSVLLTVAVGMLSLWGLQLLFR